MTPEESSIIRDVFARIRTLGPAPRDPDARAAIEAELRANPDAAMGLIRLVVALDHERAQLAADRDQLAAELNAARGASGGLFGNAGRSVPPSGPWGQPQMAPPPVPPQGSPWGQAAPPPPPSSGPWGGQPQGQSGGFMRSALGAATGVAGGLFAFEALRNVFGGHGGGLFGGTAVTDVIRETDIVREIGGPGPFDGAGPFGNSGPVDSGSGGFFDTSSDDGSSFASGDDDSLFG